MTNRILFALSVVSLSLATLPAAADQGASSQITTQAVDDGNVSISISYGDAFIDNAQDLAANDPYLYFLNMSHDQLQSSQKIFHGRAIYSVPIATAKLNKAFFENLSEIQKLVGSGSQLALVSQNPYRFSNDTSVLGGLTHLTSTQTVYVYEQADLTAIPALGQAVSQINRRAVPPTRVVVQDASNFNMYVNHGFLISLLYAEQSGNSTDVEVVSAILIDSLPLFGEGFIQDMTKDDLEGYAQRLSQENP
jgi:hypothetical protein